ncbi:fluoride efflux transporter FluC [Microbacterium sp. P02]|uniref:fluoride efflux transporter FluC n=1 Tax=Microbacterium sp. P02 TaxID=3366260 RepID=UPI003671C70E
MSPLIVAATLAAGGIGAGLRYLIDALVMRGRKGGFPAGILVVNISGSLLLGIVTALWAGTPAVTILGLGLLGGYTTFSTVSVESALFSERGRRRRALLNAVGTLVACVAAAGLGLFLGASAAG